MRIPLQDFYSGWPRTSKHPEITLTAPNGEQVRVDVSIADLHLDMWNAGVVTVASCGGDEASGAYILFEDLDDLIIALPIIYQHRPDAPRNLEALIPQVLAEAPDPDTMHVTQGINGWYLSLNHDLGGRASFKWSIHYPSLEGGDPLKGD